MPVTDNADDGILERLAAADGILDGTEDLTTVIMGDNNDVGTSTDTRYSPREHLIKVKGGALYLPVKDRLVWLRTEHPTARITTKLLHYIPEQEMWVVHARVELTDTGAIGEGLAHQTAKEFPAGPLEKAETKAIGRALAALGLGTQWALELDEEDSYADTPVTPQQGRTVTKPTATTSVGDVPAGVTELLAEINRGLENDLEAQQKLPKKVNEMSLDQLTKTAIWLRQRELARSQA